MDKEQVTEELVRQNGNQAAAVMADYAGQSGGGSASGIPTIDKNTQPNIVWRQPTAEDLAKFKAVVSRVADLPNGQVPVYLIFNTEEEPGVELCVASVVNSIAYPFNGMDGYVKIAGNNLRLSGDWTLLGLEGEQ